MVRNVSSRMVIGCAIAVSAMACSDRNRDTQARGHVTSVTRLAEGRYALELPLTPPPEETTATLIARGASLVSLAPVRDTLEDFFVQQVSGSAASRFKETA